jgi:hypothetical protein
VAGLPVEAQCLLGVIGSLVMVAKPTVGGSRHSVRPGLQDQEAAWLAMARACWPWSMAWRCCSQAARLAVDATDR